MKLNVFELLDASLALPVIHCNNNLAFSVSLMDLSPSYDFYCFGQPKHFIWSPVISGSHSFGFAVPETLVVATGVLPFILAIVSLAPTFPILNILLSSI
jgi:hypothetical protein